MKAEKLDTSESERLSAPRTLHILLLSGIVISVILLAIGLIAFLFDSELDIEESMALEPLFNDIKNVSATGIIGIGILVIISIPLVRIVAASVIFKRQGDALMVLLSIAVLAIIAAGLLLGVA